MATIWYLDDDREMLQAIRLLTRLTRHTLRAFLSSREVIQLLQAGQRPDIFLLDVNMPEVNGFEMIRFIRSQPELNAIPIVMLSSEYHPAEMKRALSLGADGYLTKPVMLDELETALQQAWKRRAT